MGATGTGKTATTAWLAERLQRPMLVMLPNKTLAAQFANELRELLPTQRGRVLRLLLRLLPTRGLRPADRHLHREGLLGQRGGRAAAALRHLVAADPPRRHRRRHRLVHLRPGLGAGVPRPHDRLPRRRADVARPPAAHARARPVRPQRRHVHARHVPGQGRHHRDLPRLPGDGGAHRVLRRRDRAAHDPASAHRRGAQSRTPSSTSARPPTTPPAPRPWPAPSTTIQVELDERLAELERENKLLEAQRLRMRTTYDLEMMQQVGTCAGIENYSRHMDGRSPGSAPNCLLDYFPEDFVLVVDESHVTIPQIGAMYEGDMSRKRTLVEHGFRLPSAMDNRPLTLERVPRAHRPDRLPVGHARARTRWRRSTATSSSRSSGRPDSSTPRSSSSRPRARSTTSSARSRAHRAQRARPRHHAHQEDGRGPHRLPPRGGHPHALPAQRGRHPAAGRAAARAPHGRVRRPRRHQPAARGPRPPRGEPRGHPRRRQGGLPALGPVAHPDHRPRGPQRVRAGHHVRRPRHRLHGVGDRRDQPPTRQAGRLQPRARHSIPPRCARRSATSPTCWPARTPTRRGCSPPPATAGARGRPSRSASTRPSSPTSRPATWPTSSTR